MTTIKLTDEQWIKVRTFLRNEPNAYVGSDEQECRRFVEGVLWMSRSGVQWRLLPAEYGKWNSVYKRFGRWCEQGVWEGTNVSALCPRPRYGKRDGGQHHCAGTCQCRWSHKKTADKSLKRWVAVGAGGARKIMGTRRAWGISRR